MRLPNLQKARFCTQNFEIHGNLGGQEPGTKKNNLNIFYLKKCLPNLQKARFCRQNCEIHGTNLQKARFCSRNCEIHGNLGGQEPGTKKNNLNIFYLKKCACPTSKKLDFALKIVKFMEIWEVRSRDKKKQFEYLLFEKVRWPNLQKARFCSQNCEIHGNLGGQEPGTEKKQFEYLLFEKMRLPNLQKARFCRQN